MTTKKATAEVQEQSVVVANPEQVDNALLREQLAKMAEYNKAIEERHNQLLAALESKGIALETPPSEDTSYRETIPAPASTPKKVPPGASLGEGDVNAPWMPWTKADLVDQEKWDFVPQYIPGAVHPIRDEKGRHKIFLDVNGLQCCLTVGVLNTQISGMFYHAYMNIEKAWLDSEEFKAQGPLTAPWVSGGLHGSNTWFYEPEAPKAWIDIDGRYYTPGAEMPMSLPEE